MPLVLKPHTATILVRSDAVSGGAVVGKTIASGGTVRGQLVRLSAVQALEQHGIETDTLGRWLQDIGAAALRPGDELSIGGETWVVMANRTLRDSLGATNYEEWQVRRNDV